VTSLGRQRADARTLYEALYRARGEMENRIKECQLDLFATCPERIRRDRTSAIEPVQGGRRAGRVAQLHRQEDDARVTRDG
jgi:hypothetical protein